MYQSVSSRERGCCITAESVSTPSSPGLFQCRSSSLKWDGLDCRAEAIAKMPFGVTLQSLSLWIMQWRHEIMRIKWILHLVLMSSNGLKWCEEGCLPQYLKFTVLIPQVIGQDFNSCFSQTVFTQVQHPKVWKIWEQSWFQNRAAACGDSAVWEPEETVTHHMNLSSANVGTQILIRTILNHCFEDIKNYSNVHFKQTMSFHFSCNILVKWSPESFMHQFSDCGIHPEWIINV